MSSTLAQLMFFGAVAFMIITDYSLNRNYSSYIWVVFFYLFIMGSKAMAYWINPQLHFAEQLTADYVSGNPIDRLFYIVIGLISFFMLLKRRLPLGITIKNNIWLFAFIAYVSLSTLWSDFRFISIKRTIKLLCGFFTVLAISTERNPREFVITLFRWLSFSLIPLSVLYIKYLPLYGIQYTSDGAMTMWVGVTTHKNSLGQIAFIASLFLIWELVANRKYNLRLFEIPVLLMALWILNGSSSARSNTSLLIFLLGSMLYVIHYFFKITLTRFVRYFLFIVSFFLILNIFAIGVTGYTLIETIILGSGRDLTLTGRTDLWKALLLLARDRPLMGTGYGSFWIGDLSNNLWDQFPWRPQQAHNGYIDLLIELGLSGVALFFLWIAFSFRNIVRDSRYDFHYAILRYSFVVIILFYNISEGSLAKPTSLVWFILMLFLFKRDINRKVIFRKVRI